MVSGAISSISKDRFDRLIFKIGYFIAAHPSFNDDYLELIILTYRTRYPLTSPPPDRSDHTDYI
jgi:hypothetical protein